MGDFANPYWWLGVEPEATEADIRAAYRRLMVKWHPDKATQRDHISREVASRLTEARDMLLDPLRRADVDRRLAGLPPPIPPPPRAAQPTKKPGSLIDDLLTAGMSRLLDFGADLLKRKR